MFAALHTRAAGVDALIAAARAFTPRFQVIGSSMVLLDVSGLTRLFGTPREIGDHLLREISGPCGLPPSRPEAATTRPRRSSQGDSVRAEAGADPAGLQGYLRPSAPSAALSGPCGPADPAGLPRDQVFLRPSASSVALASTASAAMLLALGRPGLSVVAPGDEAPALAPLPVAVLGEFERHRLESGPRPHPPPLAQAPGELRRGLAIAAFGREGGGPSPQAPQPEGPQARKPSSTVGWAHPRSSHPAQQTRRVRKSAADASLRGAECLRTLRRWGIRTLGELSALPSPDVYERLGAQGLAWQHLARGEDDGPLVPWVDEAPFEAAIDLEWPIEGLEPLSFVLSRLLEPLSARLEQADRGAAVLHLALGLTTKTSHARMLQLPAPMRDVKTLRTLLLLDLESHPPGAAVDRVRVLIEPTPARVLQWALFDRAEPAPEQVSTLLARLTALVGAGHVGSPRLVDTWRPGAFEMTAFAVHRRRGDACVTPALSSALRRFRLPIPVRVKVDEGRPIRVTTDRHGVTGGAIVRAAGPWRTSGAWWEDSGPCGLPPSRPPGRYGETSPKLAVRLARAEAGAEPAGLPVHLRPSASSAAPDLRPSAPSAALGRSASSAAWDRDEWDIAMADGTVYRLYVEREVGQWFLEGVVD